MNKHILKFLFFFTLISCYNENKRTYTVKTFPREIKDTLSPKTNNSYTTKIIQVKGFVNDTIFVSYGSNNYKNYLVNKIDTIFNSDYYGGQKVEFIFDSYKASKGELEIEFSIQ
jgi:hypothetical protein